MARRKPRKKRVPVAIVLSIAAHGALVLTLIYFTRQSVAPVKGVVSIDLIETARHDSSVPSFRPRAVKFKPEDSQPAENKPASPLEQVGDPSAKAGLLDEYIRIVREIVNRRKIYPRESLHREEEGVVKIGVSLARDGKILDLKIEEPSGFQRLDRAAMDTMTNISTFPPLPEMVEAPLHLHIPLKFSVEKQ